MTNQQRMLFDLPGDPLTGDPEDHRISRPRKAPVFAPPHNGTVTSRAAAEAIAPVAQTISDRIFDFVASKRFHGATRDEISVALKIPIPTVCARCNELLKVSDIVEAKGRHRKTAAGRKAAILVAAR